MDCAGWTASVLLWSGLCRVDCQYAIMEWTVLGGLPVCYYGVDCAGWTVQSGLPVEWTACSECESVLDFSYHQSMAMQHLFMAMQHLAIHGQHLSADNKLLKPMQIH